MQDEYDLEVDWRGFQLHPEVPPGGVRAADVFGERRVRSFANRLQSFAGEFGVELTQPERIPSTMRALAMTEYARDRGALEPLRDAVMEAHWHRGMDIEADADLRALAAEAGLDAAEALAAADDPGYRGRVKAIRAEAHERMVTAIPTFLFGSYPVVGCQRYETLQTVLRKLGHA